MPDDLTKKGPADAKRVNVHETWEVSYWTRTLGCSERELRDCVTRVGVMVDDVRRCLAGKK